MKYGAPKEVKLYYTISEVCELLGVQAHILRYWEQEFPMLRPRKNRAGNRTFREKDIDLIRKIQHLLQVEKFTIEGAMRRLQDAGTQAAFDDDDMLADEATEGASTSTEAVVESKDALAEEPRTPHPSSQKILQSLKEIRDLLRS